MIPYGRQNISANDIEAVKDVLQSDFLTQGPLVPLFENKICDYTGAKYGVATNSATSSLHIACMALGVGKGDIVWTSPISFVASSNCALYCGASVDFVDVESDSANLSVTSLKQKLIKAKEEKKLPKVVIPVHLSGNPCDMEEIYNMSLEYGFKIIEDASHAIGGTYKGDKIGNCKFSDICIFSFHPVKIITTGEGGIALTNDISLSAVMQRYRSHGITRDINEMSKKPDGPWYYEQIDLGYNYRMTDIQAALGLSQLKMIDNFIAERNEIVKLYYSILQEDDIILPSISSNRYSAFHLFIIRIKSFKNKNQIKLFESLRSNGIMVNLHYIPIYRHPYYAKMGYKPADFPESELYYKEAMSLPIYPGLDKNQIEYICNLIKNPTLNHQTLF